jgi:hypothetical protein
MGHDAKSRIFAYHAQAHVLNFHYQIHTKEKEERKETK